MTQLFMDDGKVVPVTIILAEDNIDQDLENRSIILTGTSKGKGFAGVMKRWNFSGQQATRGQSDKARAAGSIGAQTPGRVFKGKKMAGHYGNKQVTIRGSKILKVDTSKKEIMVSGPVPGARNSKVVVRLMNGESNED